MNYIYLNQFETEPLYRQLKSSIKKAIFSGHLHHGDALPSEHELANTFYVSSTVVKKAYAALESDQLIKRIQGKGTFVHYPNPVMLTHPFSYFFDEDRFETTTLAVIDLSMNAFFQPLFPSASRLVLLKQLIHHEKRLIAYQETIFPFLHRESLMEIHRHKFCLKNYLRHQGKTEHQMELHHHHTPTEADAEMSHLLNVEKKHPLHGIQTTFFAGKQRLAIGKTFLLGDRVGFHVEHHL